MSLTIASLVASVAASDGVDALPPLDTEDPMAMRFTLFSDEHRPINFRTMDRFFPSAPVEAGDDTWGFDYDLRELTSTRAYLAFVRYWNDRVREAGEADA